MALHTRNETFENGSATSGIPVVSKWLEDKTFGLGLINISLFVILNVTGIIADVLLRGRIPTGLIRT